MHQTGCGRTPHRHSFNGHAPAAGDDVTRLNAQHVTDKLDFEKLLMINSNHTKGHTCNLVKKLVRTSLIQSFLANKVIDLWNKLPSSIIDSSS